MGRRSKAMLICAVIIALCALLAGCGDSVQGDYAYVSGDDSMQGLTLSLQSDGTFVLAGLSVVMGDVRIQGNYTVEDDSVTLTMPSADGADASEPGAYKDGTLTFEDVTWQKE